LVIKLKLLLSACQRERTIVSRGDRDPSVDRPDPEHDGGLFRAEKEHKRRVEKEKSRREDRDRRERERNGRDYEHDRGRDRERLSHKRKSDHMVEDSGAEPLLHADQNFGMRPVSSIWLILNLPTYLVYSYLS
jgi:paired amphipathic helix protein Sin3a